MKACVKCQRDCKYFNIRLKKCIRSFRYLLSTHYALCREALMTLLRTRQTSPVLSQGSPCSSGEARNRSGNSDTASVLSEGGKCYQENTWGVWHSAAKWNVNLGGVTRKDLSKEVTLSWDLNKDLALQRSVGLDLLALGQRSTKGQAPKQKWVCHHWATERSRGVQRCQRRAREQAVTVMKGLAWTKWPVGWGEEKDAQAWVGFWMSLLCSWAKTRSINRWKDWLDPKWLLQS